MKCKANRIFLLDENRILPNCHRCGNELSVFSFPIRSVSPSTLFTYNEAGLIYAYDKPNGKILLMLCRHCFKKDNPNNLGG